jgi:hypothetical protein
MSKAHPAGVSARRDTNNTSKPKTNNGLGVDASGVSGYTVLYFTTAVLKDIASSLAKRYKDMWMIFARFYNVVSAFAPSMNLSQLPAGTPFAIVLVLPISVNFLRSSG